MPEAHRHLPHSGTHQFILSRSALILRLPAAAAPKGEDATFRLVSTEGPAYEQVLHPGEDAFIEDGMLELIFLGVYTNGKYSLEADPGQGKKKTWVFQERPFEALAGLATPPSEEANHGS